MSSYFMKTSKLPQKDKTKMRFIRKMNKTKNKPTKIRKLTQKQAQISFYSILKQQK